MGKRRPPRPKKRRPPRRAKIQAVGLGGKGASSQPVDPLEAFLCSYAEEIIRAEGDNVRARIGVASPPDNIIEGLAEGFVGGLGMEGAVQALAILARMAEPDHLVYLLGRAMVSGAALEQRGVKTGRFRPLLFARSMNGRRIAYMFQRDVTARSSVVQLRVGLDRMSLDDTPLPNARTPRFGSVGLTRRNGGLKHGRAILCAGMIRVLHCCSALDGELLQDSGGDDEHSPGEAATVFT